MKMRPGTQTGFLMCGKEWIDGEALELDTPLEFRSHPRALRMLVPGDVLVEAERRRARGFNPGALFAVALGRPSAALAGEKRAKVGGGPPGAGPGASRR